MQYLTNKLHIVFNNQSITINNILFYIASSTSIPLRNRASSNSTLLSEVISLTRLRPHIKTRNKHSRLRESIDCDEQEINLT